MKWIRSLTRPFRRKHKQATGPSLQNLSELLESGSTEIVSLLSANQKDTQRNLRRLHLSQQQQVQSQEEFATRLESIASRIVPDKTLVMGQQETLSLLDRLDQIRSLTCENSTVQQTLEELTQRIIAKAGLQAICQVGQEYPDQHCYVVGVVEGQELKGGSITAITQQGYFSEFGNAIRPAKVIVSRNTPSKMENSKL